MAASGGERPPRAHEDRGWGLLTGASRRQGAGVPGQRERRRDTQEHKPGVGSAVRATVTRPRAAAGRGWVGSPGLASAAPGHGVPHSPRTHCWWPVAGGWWLEADPVTKPLFIRRGRSKHVL